VIQEYRVPLCRVPTWAKMHSSSGTEELLDGSVEEDVLPLPEEDVLSSPEEYGPPDEGRLQDEYPFEENGGMVDQVQPQEELDRERMESQSKESRSPKRLP
jgi:hypothetical protein